MRPTIYNPARAFSDFDATNLTADDLSLLKMLDAWYLDDNAQAAIAVISNTRDVIAKMSKNTSDTLDPIKYSLDDLLKCSLVALEDMRTIAVLKSDDGSFDADRCGVTSVEEAIRLSTTKRKKVN